MVFKWFLNGFLNGLFGPLIVASRTSIYLQHLASIQARTSPVKFAALAQRWLGEHPGVLGLTDGASHRHPEQDRCGEEWAAFGHEEGTSFFHPSSYICSFTHMCTSFARRRDWLDGILWCVRNTQTLAWLQRLDCFAVLWMLSEYGSSFKKWVSVSRRSRESLDVFERSIHFGTTRTCRRKFSCCNGCVGGNEDF